MSLVAYESSDESSDDERNNCNAENENKITSEVLQTNDKLCLSMSNDNTFQQENDKNNVIEVEVPRINESSEKIQFNKLPKPKTLITEINNIIEEDDIPLKKEFKSGKSVKKDRVPVKIMVPSLSEFVDTPKENELKCNKLKPSNKGTKLFALLPPPKGIDIKSSNNLVPTIIKSTIETNQTKVSFIKDTNIKTSNIRTIKPIIANSINVTHESNSEDDESEATIDKDNNSITDFFALTQNDTVSNILSDSMSTDINLNNSDLEFKNNPNKNDSYFTSSKIDIKKICTNKAQKTSLSNVIDLPKEEILLKNKTEIGPKLPVPEQEYNIDTEGNVAFDDKAIEYLCGKRGVKRKPKEIEEANIIEINGEDIKPDEREWLIKALTEEPIQRPISMQGGGVSSQSKKKHQITYLAHQAKAMEMELKNQWAQNRLTRKQTQSKYGF
ncbi:proline-rich protein PRCC isoform X1 [Apis mellifera caucasica]|uniref:Proline-rich protein PRCC isoform X1 n=1 Tax=Apis mellifera TaxID=7460 RepID=A0A7M7H5J9_APIME|nr:proline-rich protein PRCC isoform X1 [Apis mellifera]KAG6797151.1 proline-rich protein PRCC isoform X1 [Apis mellifera caucasica]KAG9438038.1 proline-rich protein PRCC isoform X1 [Apis mellifera carnica]|eukprot:XP_006571445.1 proline-rich protein PRCC isoform X1 [Apis mellifera]